MTAALNLASEYLGALSKDQLVGHQAMDLSHALNRMQMVAAPVIREVIKCIHDYDDSIAYQTNADIELHYSYKLTITVL